MQGLVDYGSDSDDEGGLDPPAAVPAPAPAPVAAPTTKASWLSSLPPPKSASVLSLPPASASVVVSTPAVPAPSTSKPSKRAKGPVRILLDLPPPSATSTEDDEGPPSKRPKIALGKGGGGLGGLAAMLPAPKNESVAVKLEKALAPVAAPGDDGSAPTATSTSVGFVPYSVGKGKKPAETAPVAPPIIAELDFFGLGAMASTSSAPSSSVLQSKPATISSAPALTAPPVSDSATVDDPYPGYTQLPSGQWVAKDKEAYDRWMKALAMEAKQGPDGFGAAEMARDGVTDVNIAEHQAKWAQEKKAERPSKVTEDQKKPKAPVKAIGGRAKGKHQLSSLLAEARDNREELEERIAQARANRKGAGQKYGF